MFHHLIFTLSLLATSITFAGDFPSAEEVQSSWQSFSEEAKVNQEKIGYAPMDFEVVALLNQNAAQIWQELLNCHHGDEEKAKSAYLNKNLSSCRGNAEIRVNLFRLHENVRQYVLTSEVRGHDENIFSPIFSKKMIHPLFVQILLEEAAKYTLKATNDAPDKPINFGICTESISIGWCEKRPHETRNKQISAEERNALLSFRYLMQDSCNLGLDKQNGYMVLVGIMNGFGIEIFGSHYVVIQNGKGSYYMPKQWAREGGMGIMKNSFTNYIFQLEENVASYCKLDSRGTPAIAIQKYDALSSYYSEKNK